MYRERLTSQLLSDRRTRISATSWLCGTVAHRDMLRYHGVLCRMCALISHSPEINIILNSWEYCDVVSRTRRYCMAMQIHVFIDRTWQAGGLTV
jgi:hypothetical protein